MKDGLKKYLEKAGGNIKEEMVAYLANLDLVQGTFPEIARDVVMEIENPRSHLKLIESENYSYLAVQAAVHCSCRSAAAEYPMNRTKSP